ncbi:MAG: hypothetical protein JWN87_2144 [Frankiales bacterium]|nr:hypothetical protein [Frankiales bacterium]
MLVSEPGHGLLGSARGASCKVRLLRRVGTTDYVWATCTRPGEGVDVPVRLTGSQITVPADGEDPGATNALEHVFPKDIAKAIRADETRYKPT